MTQPHSAPELRLGVVGTGDISARLLAAARRVPGIEPRALFSRSRARGEAFAAAHGPLAVFDGQEAFFASGIDAVYIATPNATHAPWAAAALDRGLHVLLEKPVTLTAAEWADLCRRADRAGRILLEAMRPLHDPFFDTLRGLLPSVGRLRRVSLEFCQYSSRYDAFLAGEIKNAFNPALGNAAVMDIGVYCAAVAVALLGEPESIAARSVFLANGFEGCGEALLGYGDFYASLNYSKITQSETPSILVGEDGTLTLDRLNAPGEIRLIPRKGEPRVFRNAEKPENNMIYELTDFLALTRGEPPRHPFRRWSDGTIRLLDRIRAAAGIVF